MTVPDPAPAASGSLSRRRALLLLLAIAVPLLLFRLGELALSEPSEGRYAEVAREMVESGDWITPRLNYQKHFEKPPFSYWMTALGIRLFGANPFGARCAAALFGAGTVALTYFIAEGLYGPWVGFLAGLLMLVQPLFFVMARSVTSDSFITFWGATATACFVRWYARAPEDDPRWRWALYAAVGFGLLTKGPVALVIGLVPALALLLARRDWAALRRLRLGGGLALSAAIVAPWLILAERATPGVVQFLLFEKASRALTTTEGYHGGPIVYYVPVLLVGCMPWVLFLPVIGTGKGGWDTPFFQLWWAVVFVFFSLAAAKLIPYILPVAAPIAILNARLWSGPAAPEGPWARSAWRFWMGYVAFLAFALVAVATLPPVPLERSAIALAWGMAVLCLGYLGVCAAISARGHWGRAPILAGAFLTLFIQLGISARKLTENEVFCAERVCAAAREQARPGEKVICYQSFIRALPFALERRVMLCDYEKRDDRFDRDDPEYRANVWFGRERLLELARGPERIWIVTETKKYLREKDLAAATRVVARGGQLVLLVNR